MGIPRATFLAADGDGDERMFFDELLAYLDVQAPLAKSQTTLTISNQRKSLFERLDTDGDQRLSPRELNRAPRLLRSWDRDGDGRVAGDELPQNVRMQFAVGRPLDLGRQFDALAASDAPGTGRPSPITGPLWFEKMDRNDDRDVSRREFLGPLDVFERLDRDGDGLLNVHEAASAHE